jgi:predicted acyl esterase
VFVSDPLPQDLVMLGTGSVDLWIRSPVDDADLEVNLSEVRPDGQEMYIQSGWLRASLRKLSATATELWPDHTYRKEDLAPLVPGEWTAARVGIAGFGHVFRAGSQIRISVDTPGDSRVRWQFALKPFRGMVRYDVAHSSVHPSSVVLPVLPGVAAPSPLPACPSLRAQQCRAHAPYTNTKAAP